MGDWDGVVLASPRWRTALRWLEAGGQVETPRYRERGVGLRTFDWSEASGESLLDAIQRASGDGDRYGYGCEAHAHALGWLAERGAILSTRAGPRGRHRWRWSWRYGVSLLAAIELAMQPLAQPQSAPRARLSRRAHRTRQHIQHRGKGGGSET